MKVFLGGTCNGSTWRDELIPLLEIDYFNPVVDDWTPECLQRELEEREQADFVLYVITPKMTGAYSIAEAIDDSNKRPQKTILCVLAVDGDSESGYVLFTHAQLRSLAAVSEMVKRNGATYFASLGSVANYLNQKK